MAHPITSEEIQNAITGLEAKISDDDLEDVIEAVQEEIVEEWEWVMTAVEEDELRLVEETGDALVFEDRGKVFWQKELDHVVDYIDLLGAEQEMTPEALIAAHHNAAYRLTDYNWATSNPVVVGKPNGFQFGERFVEAVINNLISRGLSPGQAWGYYGVEIRDNSRNSWADRCGYSDHSSVSSAVRKATEKLEG